MNSIKKELGLNFDQKRRLEAANIYREAAEVFLSNDGVIDDSERTQLLSIQKAYGMSNETVANIESKLLQKKKKTIEKTIPERTKDFDYSRERWAYGWKSQKTWRNLQHFSKR